VLHCTDTFLHLVEAKIKVSTTDDWDICISKMKAVVTKMEVIAEAYDKR
jgi:hypothetical protein